ncbi:MAG: FKBP-type peptidyl-prolyl cis-trans isomerase [Chitinophagaceae bacterium]
MYKLFVAIFFSVILFACKKENSCDYDPCGYVAPSAEIQAVQSYLTTNSIVATQHCSGLFYKIESAGNGKNATPCSYVGVRYKGMLTNGTVFDNPPSAVSFNLGGLITAWKNALPLIASGGRIILYVPPSLGYGNQAVGSIPANSILIFEIDLVAVQ